MSALMLTLFSISTTLATASLATAHAAPAPTSLPEGEVVDPCLESAHTTFEMGRCVAREGRRQERRLRRVLVRLRRSLPRDARPALQREHAAWQRTRTLRCRTEASDFQGGSLMPLVLAGCLNEAARARIAEYRVRVASRIASALR